MKKYLKMLPILLYPYIYLMIAILLPMLEDAVPESIASKITLYDPVHVLVLVVIVHIVVTMAHISFISNAVKGEYSSKDLAKMTMICKLVHIPAFIIHFLLGALGVFASVWGIAFIVWAIVIDLLTIIQTGIMSITTAAKCTKDKVLSVAYGIFCSILGFVYCVDVCISIYVFIKTKKVNKKGVPSL